MKTYPKPLYFEDIGYFGEIISEKSDVFYVKSKDYGDGWWSRSELKLTEDTDDDFLTEYDEDNEPEISA